MLHRHSSERKQHTSCLSRVQATPCMWSQTFCIPGPVLPILYAGDKGVQWNVAAGQTSECQMHSCMKQTNPALAYHESRLTTRRLTRGRERALLMTGVGRPCVASTAGHLARKQRAASLWPLKRYLLLLSTSLKLLQHPHVLDSVHRPGPTAESCSRRVKLEDGGKEYSAGLHSTCIHVKL